MCVCVCLWPPWTEFHWGNIWIKFDSLQFRKPSNYFCANTRRMNGFNAANNKVRQFNKYTLREICFQCTLYVFTISTRMSQAELLGWAIFRYMISLILTSYQLDKWTDACQIIFVRQHLFRTSTSNSIESHLSLSVILETAHHPPCHYRRTEAIKVNSHSVQEFPVFMEFRCSLPCLLNPPFNLSWAISTQNTSLKRQFSKINFNSIPPPTL